MSTLFAKALNLGTGGTTVDFGSAALLDDGNFTYIIGLKAPTGMGGSLLLAKSSDATANGYGLELLDIGGSTFFSRWYITAASIYIYQSNPVVTKDAWSWIALTLNRSTPVGKVYAGAYGGSLADTGASDIGPGLGAIASDAALNLVLGTNSTQAANAPVQAFFLGRWNSVLSLATINSYAADMDGVGKASAVLYIKPTAGDTASVADTSGNGFNGAYTGTVTVVDGPDAGSGILLRPYLFS